MIRINRKQIQQDVDEWLDSPEGMKLSQPGPFLSTFLFFAAILIGLFLVCTIIGFVKGGKCLIWALTLKPFRDLIDYEGVQPLIAHGVIVNSKLASGAETEGAGMVLATFEDEADVQPNYLEKLAATIGRVYSEGPNTDEEELLYPLIEDDQYTGEKAQRVPEPWTHGREIFTYNAMLDISKSMQSRAGQSLFAFIGKPEMSNYEDVSLEQIPWRVISRGVTTDGTEPRDYPSRDSLTPVARQTRRKKAERNRVLRLLLLPAGLMITPFALLFIMTGLGNRDVEEVRRHPIVVEQIGEIESHSFSFFASLSAEKKTMVYSVEGQKGEGQLVIYDPLLGKKNDTAANRQRRMVADRVSSRLHNQWILN